MEVKKKTGLRFKYPSWIPVLHFPLSWLFSDLCGQKKKLLQSPPQSHLMSKKWFCSHPALCRWAPRNTK